MRSVAIVDYGLCNLDSVARAVEECGGISRVTDDPKVLTEASHIILPGVGSFADAMGELRLRKLDGVLAKLVRDHKVPFLGICLGMQLMASKGQEGGETAGLCLIDGEVRRLEPDTQLTRIPHVGWNEVTAARESPLFRGIAERKDFYFVHSYHFVCHHEENVLARTPYCGRFVSAVCAGTNIFGVQFHPEKSQKPGFQLLRNFISL
jgi:imidazole glycerol-phosphate synthase subunit HisH